MSQCNSHPTDPEKDPEVLPHILTIYLSPVKSTTPKTRPHHWVLILAPATNANCTFYHVLKAPQDEQYDQGHPDTISNPKYRYRYINGPIRTNEPLHSIPISNGKATLHKMGQVHRSKRREILHFAETALTVAVERMMPWTMTFLMLLEEAGVLPVGTFVYYDRVCEPMGEVDLEELLGDLGLEEREGVEELMRRMELGDGCS